MRVRLVSGLTDPMGAVVHSLSVAERLATMGHDAEVWAPRAVGAVIGGVTRPRVRVTRDAAGAGDAAARAEAAVRALAAELRGAPPADVNHAQDAVAAAALMRLRAEGLCGPVVRTVHHVDVHGDPALDEMQRASIQDVDSLLCVSAFWAERLRAEYGVEATVVANGVDGRRFGGPGPGREAAGARFGWGDRATVLALGGVSRRKGSRVLLEAFARARTRLGEGALLVIGGTGDAADEGYLSGFADDARRLGLRVAGPRPPRDAAVALLGPVPAGEMPALFHASDALAYPSTREGSGLAVLEAAMAGLPAVVSDLPVLQESLCDGRDCLMVPAGHSGALADALVRLVRDAALRARLAAGGRLTAARFAWADAARAHARLYSGLLAPV
ncbi:MAG: MSMEG_0565 family glycosyltransferase [Thermoleophilia bacterium]